MVLEENQRKIKNDHFVIPFACTEKNLCERTWQNGMSEQSFCYVLFI
jgi:hypothetical protein